MKNNNTDMKPEKRLGIICVASNSSTLEAQAFEEQVCREWCENENIEIIGVWREKLVDGHPSADYWIRYHTLRESLKSEGDKIFTAMGCRLNHPDLNPTAMVRVMWKGAIPGLEYGIREEKESVITKSKK